MDNFENVQDTKEISKLEDIWNLLDVKGKNYLKNNFIVKHVKKNEIIQLEGEKPKYMMALTKGRIKVYKEGIGGRKQIIRILKPLSFFSYRAIFADGYSSTSTSSFEDSTIIMIPNEVLLRIVKDYNEIALYFIRQLSLDLGISDARQVNLTQKHIRGRLAESLIFLYDNYGVDEDEVTINMYLSREDLANLSNMTTSNAIRTLSNFVSEKLIAIDGRKIMILNEDQLRKISKLG